MSACSSAGALYAAGDGVTRNDDKAIELYSRACNGNYMIGCVNLGGIYFDDDGPRRDEKRGVDLYRRACNAGEANGCRNLCIAYRTHRGVDPNERAPRVCEAKSRGG
jgi:TPR repeat protein